MKSWRLLKRLNKRSNKKPPNGGFFAFWLPEKTRGQQVAPTLALFQ